MSWPKFSLKYRYTIFAILIGITILGVFARLSIPVKLFPDTDPPVITIITAYPGVAAADIAKNVSKTIEEEVSAIDGIKKVTSTSQVGLSIVKAEFHYTKTVDSATLDTQNAVGRIRYKLPSNIKEPQVLSFSSADKPILTFAISSQTLPLEQVRELSDNTLKDAFQRVDGVAAIDVFGGHKRQMEVTLSGAQMRSYGISIEQIKGALKAWNITASGGRVNKGTQETIIRFDLTLETPEQIKNIVVASREGRSVFIGDIAQVSFLQKEARSAYHYNGQDAIALQIMKRGEANTVEVAKAVKKTLGTIETKFPLLDIQIADDDSVFTSLVIDNMTSTVFIALLLTIFVVLLFLANIRQAAIIALSIPVSFLMTFILMNFAGIDLNMVTMSAIILSIGLLVDDGIVVLENINRHMGRGETPFKSALIGTEEIFLADLAGTVTTISVLVPLMFLGGFVGKLFGPLALTLTFALMSSFIVSVTLIPLLSALWLREDHKHHFLETLLKPFHALLDFVKDIYIGWLKAALKYPLLTLLIGVLLMLPGVQIMKSLGSEMLPKFDGGSIMVSVDSIPGTSLDDTIAIVERIEKDFLVEDGVISVSTMMGYEAGGRYLGSRGAMDVNQAEMTITLTPRNERPRSIWEIMDTVRAQTNSIAGVTLLIMKEKGGTARATTVAPIDVRISGPEQDQLDQLGAQVLTLVQNVPGTQNVYRSWAVDTPEAKIVIDQQRASELGLDGLTIANAAYQSVVGVIATPYRQEFDQDLDIFVRYTESDRETLNDFLDVNVTNKAGINYPIREIGHIEEYLAPRIVTRENYQRTLSVLGYAYGRPLSGAIADVQKGLQEIALPDGYDITITGEQTDFAEAQKRMIRALLLGILAVYLVLVAQFRSFKHPLTIMMAIPMQIIGVALALLLAGKYLSMPALLGIILLTGTVVNNAIVLIDYILSRLRDGAELQDALVESVSVRYRPIMMTAFSDIAGMLPLALELSVGAERFSPIATVVIGGILAATLLTLVFIPVLFALFYKPSDIQKEKDYENKLA
jgi:HAE1 family hydrophobic/amphiphilic exporter-1